MKTKKEAEDLVKEPSLPNLFKKDVSEDVISYEVVWESKDFDSTAPLTVLELDVLKKIPKCILVKDDRLFIYYGAVDILLAFCFENRTTKGVPTSESARTINKLSSSLSWLEQIKSIKYLLTSFVRRSLIYPSFRDWNLSMKIIDDVQSLLQCSEYIFFLNYMKSPIS
ncbi:Protein SHQ1 [Blattella germanica]|nr:Protein SHQ1 [Blattella germanica]